MSRKINNLVRQLQAEANRAAGSGYDHFENDSASDFEAISNFLVVRKGYGRAAAENMAREAMNKPGLRTSILSEIRQGNPTLTNRQTRGNIPGKDVAAQLKVTVRRDTANINAVLPVAIFGILDSKNGYRAALQGQLPTGVTLTSVDIGETDGQPTAAVFTFTAAGPLVDTITVTCSTAPYPSVLESTIVDIFQISQIRMRLSDKTQATQFDQGLFPTVRNMWGLNRQNNLTPADFFSPEQFQEGVIDVDVDVSVDKETFLQTAMIAVAGFSVSYSFSVDVFEAWRAGR